MTFNLQWMRADAPYMPIATHGLLNVIHLHDRDVTAHWGMDGGAMVLHITTSLGLGEVAEAVLAAPLPDTARPDFPARTQALASALSSHADPLGTYQGWLARLEGPERLLLHAVATDQVLTDGGLPARNRLLRGAKSDLSAFGALRATTAEALADELRLGPDFRPGKSGSALGLMPELHTFGGTTGREAQKVGAESALLSRLLRHGILHLPPSSGTRRGRRGLGGPLVADDTSLSWPRWTVPCGPRELRILFGLAAVHSAAPDARTLERRGIDAVFRSAPQALSTTVSVFRWGRRVA